VGLLLGVIQGVRIARPLRTLSAQARHIADGDFGRRVNFRRGDEVGELADTFNVMAESLGVMVDEVQRKAGLEREVEVARSIQGLMTPPADVMTLGRFKLTGRCEMASACGGDWWSYRPLSDGRLLVVVGDVTGHGMPSAMIAATARGAVEALSIMDHGSLNAKLVLQAIDRAIRDVGGRRLMMTCFALVISPDGKLAYANAGHTFPYVVRMSGTTAELSILPMRSNPLGSNNPLIATGEATLVPGDFMVLTSDGLTDRISESGLRFGDKRLRKTLIDQLGRSRGDIASICDRIVSEVNTFGGAQPVDDDITLVVVQYTGTATDSKTERGVAA
jgi:sigma-B regulation protein RsbU (phosphoserine phosphatase)